MYINSFELLKYKTKYSIWNLISCEYEVKLQNLDSDQRSIFNQFF